MSPRFFKHRLLLDEGLPYRRSLPRINARYNVKHVKEDLRKSGLSDEEVYQIAAKLKRLLVVFNVKDYRGHASKSKDTGVIGISQNLSTEQTDKKLSALLSRSSEKTLFGKLTLIPGASSSR